MIRARNREASDHAVERCCKCKHADRMPVMIQLRNVPSDLHRELMVRASRQKSWLEMAFLVDFGGGAEDSPALFAVHAGELFGEEAQLARGFLVEAPDRAG